MALPLRSGRYRSDFTPQNGTEWDDGAHVKVHKIRTFHNHSGITLVQFDYKDHMGTAVVHGLNHGTVPFNFHREHGRVLNQTAVETEVLLEDDEHIVTVTAYVGFCLRQIVFETNKQREIMFGVDVDPEQLRRTETRDPNLMHEVPCTYHLDDGSTIVGFHGTRGVHYIQEFGVYYSAPQN